MGPEKEKMERELTEKKDTVCCQANSTVRDIRHAALELAFAKSDYRSCNIWEHHIFGCDCKENKEKVRKATDKFWNIIRSLYP